jgi:2-hydroxychromene-2-carboxylate isomerase
MTKQVEFYYDYASPTCYLAWTQLPAISAKHGAALIRKPILLGGVFKATGNTTPVSIPAKGQWMFKDIQRYAKFYGVPLVMNPHFLLNSLPAMRGAIWASRNGQIDAFDRALFEASWAKARNIGDLAELSAIVSEAGLDAKAMAEGIQTDEVKKTLIDQTEQAVERGVFGAPAFFVGDEMHFGQDRLPWIERALAPERL